MNEDAIWEECKKASEINKVTAKQPRRTLAYPILLDDNYMAQVVIPFDLSASECQRMTAFLNALVVPWRTK